VTAGPIRVVIVDDSDIVRQVLRRWLTPATGFQIVGEAPNGRVAVELVIKHRPQIVVMDVDMPVMDGLEATRLIMNQAPTPILIFTSSRLARERKVAFEALAAGALDVFHKPRLTGDDPGADSDAGKLRKLLTLLAPIKVISRHASRAHVPLPPHTPTGAVPRMLAIAASTGGPVALVKVLNALPPTFPLCTLLVQHQSAEFMDDFVAWLGENIKLPVKTAVNGESLRPSVVMVAPGDHHMRLAADGRIRIDRDAPIHACRPAADALFTSVAQVAGPKAIGVLLTGMGKDGARGLLDMRQAGAVTIAQDENTSVVYGMPKEAADIGAVSHVLPLEAIGEFIQSLVTTEARS
jgi:two-component system chemotaxis response regulator CheB